MGSINIKNNVLHVRHRMIENLMKISPQSYISPNAHLNDQSRYTTVNVGGQSNFINKTFIDQFFN